jgi:membrane protease YdiL (CAAX protease family)
MELAAAASPPPAEAPVIGGRPVEWTMSDVAIGIGLAVAFFVAQLFVTAPFALFGEESGEFYTASLIATAVWEVGLVVIAAVLTWRKYGGSWERLGLKRPGWPTLGWAAAGYGATLAFGLLYNGAIWLFDIDALRSQCDDQIPRALLDNTGVLILATVTVVTFAPVCEEVFFRGFAFPGMWRAWGLALGVIASALLFSGAHVGPSMHKTIIPIFVIGSILALTYWRSGNLLSAILLHFANNSFAAVQLWNC